MAADFGLDWIFDFLANFLPATGRTGGCHQCPADDQEGTGVTKQLEVKETCSFLVCLSVCLSVCLFVCLLACLLVF